VDEPTGDLTLDRRLLRLAETDDETDWAELLAAEGGFLRAVARDHLDGEDLVDDTVQEAVLRCRRALRHYRSYGEAEARYWLRLVVRHTALDLICAERSRRRRERTAGEEAARHDHEHGHRRTMDADYEERMESSLDELPTKQRSVIDLHYFFGLSFGAIAERLRMTPNHVHVLHKRALGSLRKRLAPAGVPVLSAAALTALLAARGEALEPPPAPAAGGGGDGASVTTGAGRRSGRLARSSSRARWWWVGGLVVTGAVVAVITFVPIGHRPADGGRVIRRIELAASVPPFPFSKGAAVSDSLFFASGPDLHRVDPRSGVRRPGDALRVKLVPEDSTYAKPARAHYYLPILAGDGDRLWFVGEARRLPPRLFRWDPATGEIERRFDLPEPGHVWRGLAAGDGKLWLVLGKPRELLTLDQADGRVLSRVAWPAELDLGPIANSGGGVWTTDGRDGGPTTLVKLDPATGRILARLPAPTDEVTGLCAGGPERLWVIDNSHKAWLVDVTGK